MSIVALPVRFGTDRFGKVVGGTLDSDNRPYPQPGGIEVWQPGMTTLVVSPWADPEAERYGMMPNALLSGGDQQLYGEALYGWLFFDPLNRATWLLEPQVATADTEFSGGLSLDFKIRRFGLFSAAGKASVSTVTKTLSDWGQSTPDITEYGDCTHAPEAALLWLVSAKTDGSAAILMASLATDHPYQELPWLHQWPIGFIGVACTAVEGDIPALTLSVLRDRATTVGVRTSYAVDGGLTPGNVCGGSCSYESGSETFTQGVSDAILALVYVDDALVELVASAQITGSNVCGTPYAELEGMAQDSSGTIRLTWTLSNGTDEVSWYYELQDAMHAYVNCSSGTSTWATDRTETFNGETITIEDFDNGSGGMTCYLEHTDANTGTFAFLLSVACRAPGDLWEDHYTEFPKSYLSWSFRRYAYAVIGLYAEADGDPVRGDCITPTGTIAAANVGTGDYGAFNARTGAAVAGLATPVGYV